MFLPLCSISVLQIWYSRKTGLHEIKLARKQTENMLFYFVLDSKINFSKKANLTDMYSYQSLQDEKFLYAFHFTNHIFTFLHFWLSF